MTHLRRLLAFTFCHSMASVMMQRGAYYFTDAKFEFRPSSNLLLALCAGAAYVLGALPSHAVTRRLGEKRVLLAVLFTQVALGAAIAVLVPRIPQTAGHAVLWTALTLYGFFNGMGWPIVESYISAGQSPSDASRSIGFFNITWAVASPTGLLLSGLIIDHLGAGLFGVSAVCTLMGSFFISLLPAAPQHQAHDHPDRPASAAVDRLRPLLTSSRCSMAAGYALLYVLAPLLPGVFKNLGFSVAAATALNGVIDATRAVMFLAMMFTHRWHNRRDLLLLAAVLLPAGFLLVLLVPHTAAIVVGEMAFGVGMGLSYYAALYYAMVVGNASVDAGGAHEAMIGSGFALGPMVALIGAGLGSYWHLPANASLLLGVVPLLTVLGAGGLIPLMRRAVPVQERAD